jgi:hypothetical protein
VRKRPAGAGVDIFFMLSAKSDGTVLLNAIKMQGVSLI